MAITMGKVTAYLELDTSKFSKGFVSARNDLKVFLDQSSTATQKINGLSSAMSTVGGILSKTTLPIVGVGTAAIKTAADFESAMSQVKAISNATGSEFENLKDEAIELGSSTVFSASEVANAMTEMAKAGWSSQQIMDGMSGVLDAAAASGEDLATVSTIIADSITTFGLSASESARVADLLSQSANAGTISVYDLGESIKYIGPVAKTMGFEIEDVVTAITALSTAGIKGSQAGTSLRTMFARLVKPTENVQAAIDELGIVLTDNEGNFLDMNTILESMREKFSRLTPEQQTYYATVLAGQEGMSGLTALLSMTQEEYDNIARSMENATGTAERTAEVMQDNVKGALEQFSGAAESAGIVLGNRMLPYIRRATEYVTGLTERINEMSDEQLDSIVHFAGMAAAIGPVLLVSSKLLKGIKTLGSGIGTVITQVRLFSRAMTAAKAGMTDMAMETSGLFRGITSLKNMLNPMTLGITAGGIALTALGIATYNARKETEAYREKLREETEEQRILTEAIEEQTTARQESKETLSESVESALSEAEAQQALADKLAAVVDENGRIIEGKETYAKVIANELSEALGIEIGIVDGQIQNYSALSDEIYKTIDAKRALAVQEAMSEEYGEALKKQIDARQQYNDTIYERIDLETQLADAQEELRVAQEAVTQSAEENGVATYGVSKRYEEAQEKVNALNDKIKENGKQLEEATENYEYWNQVVENYEGLSAAIIENDSEKIDMAMLKIQESFLTSETATKESLEKQKTTLEEKYAEMQKAFESGYGGVTQEMLDQMGQLVNEADAQYQESLDKTKQDIVTAFTNMGIEAPQGLIDALSEKSTDVQTQVTSLFQLLTSGTQIGKDQIVRLFDSIGFSASDSLIKQLSDASPDVQLSAIELLTQLQYAEESKRPEILQQLRDLGVNVDSSVAEGIQGNVDVVKTASSGVGIAGNVEIAKALGKEVESPDVSDNTVSSARSVAEAARNAMQAVFNARAIRATVSAVGAGAAVINGSHAEGLAYVPFDGYIAELHKGERVLTREENREYNNSGVSKQSGDIFNFYNTQPTPYEYARQMKKAKKELLYGI